MELKEGDFLEGSTERWQVKRFLGQGKCCTVYEACCHGGGLNGARAAVKIYKKEERYSSAGMNEATLLQMLHADEDAHCKGRLFIVSILDVFHYEGHLCLLNESLSQSLHSIFAVHGCHGNGLPLYVVQKVCRDLSCGLEYLKAKRVVHADIKPTNLMWNSEKELFQFVDFGLSYREEEQPLQQIQSPGYQSPEVKQWNKNIMIAKTQVDMCNCSCDTWSMACVLFLLYSGQHLFQPEEDIPFVCNNCQKDGICIHGITLKSRLNENLPSKWIILKGVTKQHHDTMLDLLTKMLVCKPRKRITPDKIGSHPFLNATNTIRYPSLSDLVVLPTKVLQLTNMFEKQDELNNSDEYEEFIEDIQQECERFGTVVSICVPFLNDANSCDTRLTGKVFVKFSNSKDCESARRELTGRTFNDNTIVTSYFPIKNFQNGEFY